VDSDHTVVRNETIHATDSHVGDSLVQCIWLWISVSILFYHWSLPCLHVQEETQKLRW